MTHPTYNNKRIIWESKTRQVLVVIVSFLFVAAAIWTKNEYSSFVFWSTIIFFGGCGLFMLIRFINPNNLFVTHDTALGKKILADQFQKSQEDLGFFAYTDTGFNLREHTGVGWYQLNKRLNNAIPTVLENWDTEIMQPPFVTNMTLLFDKDNRGKEQAERACYGF
jgi:hypothetical protein